MAAATVMDFLETNLITIPGETGAGRADLT